MFNGKLYTVTNIHMKRQEHKQVHYKPAV